MIFRRFSPLLFFVSIVGALSSCSAGFSVALKADGAASVDMDSSVGPRTATLIANLAGFAGNGSGASSSGPVLDAAALSRSLRNVSGISSASLRNPDARSLAGSVAVSRLDRFLSPKFVRVERTSSGGTLSVFLDRESAPAVISSLSPELSDYLTALMAPAATGDFVGTEDYLSSVSSVYGAGVAQEIRTAKVRATVELPGPVRSAKGGTFSGRKVEFSLPVAELLVLEKPIVLEATW